ncbi:MAG TPA: phosphatidylglycerophosphatase A [Thermodesulfovibrionales bacterium]|nr:phosphatidylglycerophosphatase A [Thermodesulfovibrionales bacterium]
MRQFNFGQRIFKTLATLGPIGYSPVAPGTFGSLFALLFYYFLKPSLSAQVFLLILVTVVGTIAAHLSEKMLNEKDSGHIVIDEFAGYAVSIFMLPGVLSYFIAAFFLFRFFDILKPPPIRWMERTLPGGPGIVADDLMAGIYANLVMQIWMHLT